MADHLEQIRQRIQEAVRPISAMSEEMPTVQPTPAPVIPAPQPVVPPVAIQPPKKADSPAGVIFVGALVVVVSLALIFLMSQRKDTTVHSSGIASGPNVTRQSQQPRYMSSEEARAWTTNMNTRLTSLEEKVQSWGYRTWLLSVVVDENANLSAVQHPGAKAPITLDENWKLTRPPETLRMDQEQQRELKRALK